MTNQEKNEMALGFLVNLGLMGIPRDLIVNRQYTEGDVDEVCKIWAMKFLEYIETADIQNTYDKNIDAHETYFAKLMYKELFGSEYDNRLEEYERMFLLELSQGDQQGFIELVKNANNETCGHGPMSEYLDALSMEFAKFYKDIVDKGGIDDSFYDVFDEFMNQKTNEWLERTPKKKRGAYLMRKTALSSLLSNKFYIGQEVFFLAEYTYIKAKVISFNVETITSNSTILRYIYNLQTSDGSTYTRHESDLAGTEEEVVKFLFENWCQNTLEVDKNKIINIIKNFQS